MACHELKISVGKTSGETREGEKQKEDEMGENGFVNIFSHNWFGKKFKRIVLSN